MESGHQVHRTSRFKMPYFQMINCCHVNIWTLAPSYILLFMECEDGTSQLQTLICIWLCVFSAGIEIYIDKIIFLLISTFIRRAELNTESTTSISSTLRYEVLIAVPRWQLSGVCWCVVWYILPWINCKVSLSRTLYSWYQAQKSLTSF